MLQVKNLTKIYSNGTASVTALSSVNFTLDDHGFVFITGKSGCGKTTLLSIIGGLDSATEGTIICDGNDMSTFTDKDFDNYRNTYLGFVFQDFCLIDDLDVYHNIETALNIKGETFTTSEKELLIENALKSVDLDNEIKNRYVKELSGGQKQRVAIARALVKNPKLILADEPTGNLDSKTSKKILTLLKKLSKDRLVVIVSHNKEDAKTYADRIIEFADGVIISDKTRTLKNSEKMTIKDGVLILPHTQDLTAPQLNKINKNLQDGTIKSISQSSSGFIKTPPITKKSRKVNIEPKKMKFASTLSLSKFFIKKRVLASCVTVLVISLLVFVLGLCQFLIQFQESETVLGVMQQNNETDILLYKGYYNDDGELSSESYVKVYDEEIQKIKNSGYTGNIYKLYWHSFPFAESSYNLETGKASNSWSFIKNFYLTETMGTLACDINYLTRIFGVDGEVCVLAGNLTDRPEGIIITDYVADSMIALSNGQLLNYDAIVGTTHNGRMYINAIIKTNFNEKYVDLFKYFDDLSMNIDRNGEEQYFKEKITTFLSDVQKYYGITYSINPNFDQDIAINNNVLTTLNYLRLSNSRISKYLTVSNIFTLDDLTLTGNEIAMGYTEFNQIFGRIYGYYNPSTLDTFEPFEITLEKFNGHEEGDSLYKKTFVIKGLIDNELIPSGTNSIYVSKETFDEVNSVSRFAYGLLLDDSSQLKTIYSTLENNPYSVKSRVYQSVSSVGEIVVIFDEFFGLILAGIAGVSIILLVSYAYGNIKKRYYEIGVLKSLGATTKNVGFVFSLQTILAGGLICIVSTVMLLTLSGPINLTISNKLLEFVNNSNLGPLQILQINIPTLIVNVITILIVTTLSCVIPLIKLHKIKPKNIIANKD